MRITVLVPLAAACASDYDVADNVRVDVFPQVRVNAVDLLLVVDNSGSMVEEQDHLARSFDSLISSLEQGDSDWRVAVVTTETSDERFRGLLAGGTDEVVLDLGGTVIDRVAWDDTAWPLAEDTALALCTLDADANDDSAAWTSGAGTPGAPNPCATGPDPGPDAGPRPPAPGDVVVSEIAPWSTGECDWVELASATPDTLDLGGLVLRDDGRDAATIPAGTLLAPGAVLVAGTREPCATADLAFAEGFDLAHGVRWVEPDTPDAARVFADLVAVGTSSFGLEMGLENATLALTAEAFQDANRGFLRPEADLSLLFLSDEDDISHEPVADYVDAFRSIKGDDAYRDRDRVRFGVVAGIDPPPEAGAPSCESDLGVATYAERYVALALETNALRRSICEDLSTIAVDAGLTLSGLLAEFQLSGLPNPETLAVELYENEDDGSLVELYALGVDYELEVRADEEGREAAWIVFADPPPGEHWVLARYSLLPEGATLARTGP